MLQSKNNEVTHFTGTVLIYGMPVLSKQASMIKTYLQRSGIRLITAQKNDLNKSLFELFGLGKLAVHSSVSDFQEPVMVIFGLPEPMLDQFLAFLRTNAPVRLKAVATPHNMQWSLGQLAMELSQEHKAMTER